MNDGRLDAGSRIRRHFICVIILTLCILLSASSFGVLFAQSPHTQIIVERQVKGGVQVTSPQLVFHSGDLVRFRFKSSFDGYLYVMDQSTSGKYLLLFPAKDAPDANRIERDREYLIPATRGTWFRVDNPPGYETIYFVISAARLEKRAASNPPEDHVQPLPAEPPPATAPAELLPRCDDAVFRARGECIDVLAGPRAVGKDDAVPSQLPVVPAMSPRDITVINKHDSTVVAPANGADGPLIYQFRLAHK
jgi:Domain of unknown function (DUF4384)